MENQNRQDKKDVGTVEWAQKFNVENECQQLEISIYGDDQDSCAMKGRVRMEGAEELERRIRKTTILGSKEVCQHDTWIKKKAGQPDRGSGISKDGT